MTGDPGDMLARLRAVLPDRWFPDPSPVLDSLLTGLSSSWAALYRMLQYVGAQTRVATATGMWLDMISLDFFGENLLRRSSESDSSYRKRIMAEMFREHGTRRAVISVLQDLTGRVPAIFEPALPTDTGGYGSALGPAYGLSYGGAGGWGSLELPFQSFITAFRPSGSGIAMANGWGQPGGGYGRGCMEYGSLAMIEGQVTDNDLYAAVARVLPVASVAWMQISD